MRKTMSIVLSVLMIAALFCFGASAAAGTAINDAAGFAGMTADGTYYLDTDITIDTTYASTFTGVLDGNGHKVTTSVPMFAEMNGTVKNLTVAGNIEVAEGYAGAVAIQTSATETPVVYQNITNNANVKATASGAGGILGYGKGNTNIKMVNCVNNGTIESNSQTGGLIGYIQGKTVEITGCTNKGKVNAYTTYGGGIICRFGKDAASLDYTIKITGCVNEGEVIGTKDQTGGIIGYHIGDLVVDGCTNKGKVSNTTGCAGGILGNGASDKKEGNTEAILIQNSYNYGEIVGANRVGGLVGSFGKIATTKKYEINNSGNYGKIVLNGDPASTSNLWAAGIAAYAYGGKTDNGLHNCFNLGDIEVSGQNVGASGLIGYVNSAGYFVENCYNAGKITNTATSPLQTSALYYNKSASSGTDAYEKNNWAADLGDEAIYVINGETAIAQFNKFAASDLTDGKLAAAINKAAGSTVYYQNEGAKGPETFNGTVPTPPPSPVTGDSAVIFAAVAVVAVLGVAVVAKKRKVND